MEFLRLPRSLRQLTFLYYSMRVSHLLNSGQYWIRVCLQFCRVNNGKYISDVLVCMFLVISEDSCLSHVHWTFYLLYESFMSTDKFSIEVLRIPSWPGRNPCMWKALALCHLSSSMWFAFNFIMFLIFKHFFLFLVAKSLHIFPLISSNGLMLTLSFSTRNQLNFIHSLFI